MVSTNQVKLLEAEPQPTSEKTNAASNAAEKSFKVRFKENASFRGQKKMRITQQQLFCSLSVTESVGKDNYHFVDFNGHLGHGFGFSVANGGEKV